MWARIDGDRVAEITDIDPQGRFHPSLFWVECGEDVEYGWTYDGDKFAPSEPVESGQYVPQQVDKSEQIRAERDAKIEAMRWRIERAKDETALGVPLTEPLEPLLQHVQALRDVPAQAGFPQSVEWPPEP